METKINPVIGEEYSLFLNELWGTEYFKGIYLGRREEKTEWFLKPKRIEGHLFLKLNQKGEIEMYTIRTGEKNNLLKYWYECDGYDDPAVPVGFQVNKMEIDNFNVFEKRYIQELLNKHLKQRGLMN